MSHNETTTSTQPTASPQMSAAPQDSLITQQSKALLTGAAKETGEEVVKYEANLGESPQQQLNDAEAKAQGLWAKYCGCLGSV